MNLKQGLRIRHKKRGSEYIVLLLATAQCSTEPIQENDSIAVYAGEDGRVWARKISEIKDGRFEEI